MKPPKCAGRNTACAFWDSGILLYSHGMKRDENFQITEIFGYVSSAVYDSVALNNRFFTGRLCFRDFQCTHSAL